MSSWEKKAFLFLACYCLGKIFSRCFYVHLSICMESSFPLRDTALTLDRKQPFFFLFVCFYIGQLDYSEVAKYLFYQL